MKKIQSFIVWVNGKNQNAQYLALILNNDNLLNQAIFYWCFYNEIDGMVGNKICDGNITMTGSDYTTYNSSSNSNQFAWNWAAQQLGVTIIS